MDAGLFAKMLSDKSIIDLKNLATNTLRLI